MSLGPSLKEFLKNNGFKKGTGIHQFPDGCSYDGQCKDEKRNGTGKQLNSDGSSYDGEWKDDFLNGSGKFLWPNGSSYEGEWKDDKQNGTGKYLHYDGSSYEGEWKNNVKHGTGRSLDSDGSLYEGEWNEDFKHGTGKQLFPNGSCYEGDFLYGVWNGYGKYLYSDGSSYEGEWKNGKQNGTGKYLGFDGSTYEGEWKDGVRNGAGKYLGFDGSTYEGEWKDDVKHGNGVYLYPDGSIYEGEWKDGISSGIGKYLDSDGSSYEEEWKEGLMVKAKHAKPINEEVAQLRYSRFNGPDDQFCEFQYVRVLGNGGFGEVHSVTITQNNIPEVKEYYDSKRELALKTLFSQHLDEIKKENLLRFRNDNVVRYVSIGWLPGVTSDTKPRTSLLMEFHQGGTLNELAVRHQLQETVILGHILQVVRGVEYLHQQNPPFILGDLKGQNILLTKDQKILKIADLDNCIQLKENFTCRSDVKEAVGSQYHMSPEMLNLIMSNDGQLVGRSTDIWSVGCTVLEMFGRGKVQYIDGQGQTLSANLNLYQFAISVENGSRPYIFSEGATNVMSTEFHKLIAACLLKDRSKRPKASELLTRIETVINTYI